jgi:hypothetical protein
MLNHLPSPFFPPGLCPMGTVPCSVSQVPSMAYLVDPLGSSDPISAVALMRCADDVQKASSGIIIKRAFVGMHVRG